MVDGETAKKVIDLPIDDVLPNRYQPRIKFDDTAIFELSESIKAHGVFQPIIVRPIGDKYEIIAGERRYKASVLANKETIPAIIMSLNDKDSIEIALIENVQRKDLTPIEEAISYKKILDMGYIKQEELARKLGVTQSTVANKLRLLNLVEEAQEALIENKISERHARSLLRLKNDDDQIMMLNRIINERLTVRMTDEEIKKIMNENINNNQNFMQPEVPTQINTAQELPVIDLNGPQFNQNPVQGNNPSIFGFTNNNEIINANPTMGANNSTVIASSPVENVQTIAPTLMNIDSIRTDAAPVYEEKPLASMEDLLKPASSMPAPSIPVAPVMNTPVENNSQAVSSSDGRFFGFGNDNPVSNQPVESAPAQNNNFGFNNFSTPAPIENQNKPVLSPMLESQLSPTNMVVPNSNMENVAFDVQQPINNPQPVENIEISVPSSPIGGMPMINESNPTISQPAFVSPTIDVPNVSVSNQSDFTAETIPPVSQISQQNNVMNAVNVIRDAVKKLESLGFAVDVDEIDLESMYQLIIKIDK